MIKLRQIISQLDDATFRRLESKLQSSRAENFLHLLRRYRSGEPADSLLAEELAITSNSLYVLKSRLNDRIQESLSGDLFENRETIVRQLQKVAEMLYEGPPEITETFLQKLESDLLRHDLHHELMQVYSALKKLTLYSPRYYHYSQAYNRHVAFNLALEKSEELLADFNRLLAEYDFSRSAELLDKLLFMIRDIGLHHQLHQSTQIALMRNIAELSFFIHTGQLPSDQFDAAAQLRQTEKILHDLPQSSPYKNWTQVLEYLCFEYYRRNANDASARAYYQKVDENMKNILLYSGVCLSAKFLHSRIQYSPDSMAEALPADQLFCMEQDQHATVLLHLYEAMRLYYANKLKEATRHLNDILNTSSFKDLLHISIEIRLSLAFIYTELGEDELAEQLIKSVTRKIKNEKSKSYEQVLHLVKVLNAVPSRNATQNRKLNDELTLFLAKNQGEQAVLLHLLPALKKRYLKN